MLSLTSFAFILLISASANADRESIICETLWDIPPSQCCPLPPPNLTTEQQNIYRNAIEKFHTTQNGCKSFLPYFKKTLKVYRNNGDVSVSAIKTIFAPKTNEKLWKKVNDNSIRTCIKKSE